MKTLLAQLAEHKAIVGPVAGAFVGAVIGGLIASAIDTSEPELAAEDVDVELASE